MLEGKQAVLLNPFGYHDIYEEVAWTGSWDKDEGSRAANQSHFVTYHHRIRHHTNIGHYYRIVKCFLY